MADIIDGSGSDTISGTNKSDYIDGGLGNDVVDGGNGNDVIVGGEGNDSLDGNNGVDTLFGGNGNDIMVGGTGADILYGGAGDDTIGLLNGTPVNDTGGDVIYGDGFNTYNRTTGLGDQQVTGTTLAYGNDKLYGGNGVDVIYGDSGLGGTAGGNDFLWGGNGADQLFGEGGADVLNGGLGADLLSGGEGSDRFEYLAVNESSAPEGIDTISDFTARHDGGTAKDLIDVDAFLGSNLLNWGNTTATANGVWYAQSGGNTLVYADTTGDGVADWSVKLNGTHTLSNADFIGVKNTGPVIQGGSSATVSIDENTTAVTTIVASDADAGSVLSYSIAGGVDAGKFSIDAATGALKFVAAPNAEAPADVGTNNIYDVTVRVSDGLGFSDQAVSVKINDLNEFAVSTPVDSNAAANAVNENVAVGTVVGITAFASDADATTNTVSYSLSDDASGLFAIDAATGVVTTAAAIDREALGASKTIEVTATSADGSAKVQSFSIAINDLNDVAPAITSGATGSEAENSPTTNAVYTVTATDPDTVGVISYALTGTDAALFNIDSASGTVTFKTSPNFEAPTDAGANNVYDIVVHASDSVHDVTKAVAISVTNVNEAPTITSNATIGTIHEHLINSTLNGFDSKIVGSVSASDPDAGTTFSYSITNDSSGGAFSINTSTGQVSVRDVSLLDFEGAGLSSDAGGSYYSLTVSASDGASAVSQSAKIYLTNVTSSATTNVANYVDGGNNADTFNLNNGDDVAFGDGNADSLGGQNQNDMLFGGAGNDTLDGGNGNDTLYGGAGADTLTGGGSNTADTFVFGDGWSAGVDTITDFNRVDGDKLLLVTDYAGLFTSLNSVAGGAVDPTQFASGSGLTAADAGHSTARILYDTATGNLWYDADGVGGAASVQFATITGHQPLQASDILVGAPPGP
jgi:Ca2+-binding RTX toxin-like protein